MSNVVVFADGACRGNPGPASYGLVAYHNNKIIHTESVYIGEATNNIAEYKALIAALQYANKLQHHESEIKMDSQLVVFQMNGLFRVKHPDLLKLYTEAIDILGQIDNPVTITHIRRWFNVEADLKANLALDKQLKESDV